MFGSRIVRGLLDARQPVRALVRSRSRGGDLETAGAELAVGDMDRPETLPQALEGVQRVFLVSPMDDAIDRRERAVTVAAKAAGVELVIKLYGAVKHREDPLDRLHLASIAALRERERFGRPRCWRSRSGRWRPDRRRASRNDAS